MRKLLLGLGYLTWLVCNIAIIYGVGYGAMLLIESESIGGFLFKLAAGLFMLMLLAVISGLILGAVASMFGDEAVKERVTKWFPFLDM
jgi:hypothetical protein